jgi:BirA family transcriptional regulator, biotin operon repressor / biotin---[acetyl-CoA-carboxylase] ligase
VEHLARVTSTSDVLKDRARAGAPEWSVVIADAQTAGRGRLGRAWQSEPGNLHLSVLLRPRGPVVRGGRLPLLAGLAVAEAVGSPWAEALVKWPNDVWIAGRKVAGVLVEASSAGGTVESAVVGVGVNVRSVPEGLDAETRAGAACLADFGPAPEVLDVAAAVLARIRVWYHRVAEGDGGLLDAWRARSLPWWGRRVEARAADGVVSGRAVGIDDDGALILMLEDGTRSLVHSGDVREVRAT